MQDILGCAFHATGAKRDETLDAWNKLCHAFLSHSYDTPTHLGNLLAADPDNVLGQCCKGFFMLLAGRSECLSAAASAVERVEALKAQSYAFPAREDLYVRSLLLAHKGQWFKSAKVLEGVFDFEEQDAMAFKIIHALRFMLGDRFGLRASSLKAIDRFDKSHFATGYVYGCHAFALEETGDYKAAEKYGKSGVELCPDDAWGLHAVAHVYDMTARARLGIEWLERRQHQWVHCNNFVFHFFWHLALHYLEVGDYVKVLELYDQDIRKQHTDDYRDISNATSLLARLEGLGVDVGDRWEELNVLCARRADDNCVVFADLHYMQALGRSNNVNAMDKLIATMRNNAQFGKRDMDDVNDSVGVVAAEGIKAYYAQDFAKAFQLLRSARPRMQQIGGSHAQRDTFERMTIDAGLLAGEYAAAKALIEDRTWRRSQEDSFARRRLVCAINQKFELESRIAEPKIIAISA